MGLEFITQNGVHWNRLSGSTVHSTDISGFSSLLVRLGILQFALPEEIMMTFIGYLDIHRAAQSGL